MKKLLLSLTVIMLFAASCTTGKSFLKQRYTTYGHKKNHVKTATAENETIVKHTRTEVLKPASAPLLVNTPALAKPAEATTVAGPAVLTANAATVAKAKSNAAPGLTRHIPLINNGIIAVKKGFSQLSDKQVKHEQTKRGLLFGIISDLLSILILVIVVVLIVWLVLILL